MLVSRTPLVLSSALLAALGCGGARPAPTPPGPAAVAASPDDDGQVYPKPDPSAQLGACPTADRVVVISYAANSTGDGIPITPMWRAYLQSARVDGGGASYKAATADEARAAGLAALPKAVWIPVGATMCKATVARAFVEIKVDPPSRQVGVELTGCAAPKDPVEAFGLVGDEDLAGCVFEPSHEIAARTSREGEGPWQPKDAGTPIPAELAKVAAAPACTTGCEPLWSATAVGPAQAPVAYGLLQTWMKPTKDAGACEVPHDDARLTVVRTPRGLVPLDTAVVGNHLLAGAFHDAGGARLVVLQDTGEFAVYSAQPKPAFAFHRRVFTPNEETRNFASAAPYCGP